MNFLRALAERTLQAIEVAEAPRVPFVTTFPEQALDQEAPLPSSAPVQARATPSHAPRAHNAAMSAPLEASQESAFARVERTEVERTIERSPAPLAPLPAAHVQGEAPTSVRVERVVERWLPASSQPATAPEPHVLVPHAETRQPVQPPPAPPRERVEVHHTSERISEQVVERIVEAPRSEPVHTRAARAPVEEAMVRPRMLLPAPAPASPVPEPVSERAPAAPPQINVSIGRIVVRLGPPPAPARAEPARLAPPALTLDAYNARKRGPAR
jgi:hypothetical protein